MNAGSRVLRIPLLSPLLSLLALLALASLAQGAPSKLICQLNSTYIYADTPPTIDIDDEQHAVTIHMPAEHLRDADNISGGDDGYGGMGPYTIGPAPGAFTADIISVFTPASRPGRAGRSRAGRASCTGPPNPVHAPTIATRTQSGWNGRAPRSERHSVRCTEASHSREQTRSHRRRLGRPAF